MPETPETEKEFLSLTSLTLDEIARLDALNIAIVSEPDGTTSLRRLRNHDAQQNNGILRNTVLSTQNQQAIADIRAIMGNYNHLSESQKNILQFLESLDHASPAATKIRDDIATGIIWDTIDTLVWVSTPSYRKVLAVESRMRDGAIILNEFAAQPGEHGLPAPGTRYGFANPTDLGNPAKYYFATGFIINDTWAPIPADGVFGAPRAIIGRGDTDIIRTAYDGRHLTFLAPDDTTISTETPLPASGHTDPSSSPQNIYNARHILWAVPDEFDIAEPFTIKIIRPGSPAFTTEFRHTGGRDVSSAVPSAYTNISVGGVNLSIKFWYRRAADGETNENNIILDIQTPETSADIIAEITGTRTAANSGGSIFVTGSTVLPAAAGFHSIVGYMQNIAGKIRIAVSLDGQPAETHDTGLDAGDFDALVFLGNGKANSLNAWSFNSAIWTQAADISDHDLAHLSLGWARSAGILLETDAHESLNFPVGALKIVGDDGVAENVLAGGGGGETLPHYARLDAIANSGNVSSKAFSLYPAKITVPTRITKQ